MIEYLKRFWALAVSLAGIVGLYLGAVAIHVVIWFWITIGVAGTVASFSLIGPRMLELGNRIRNYPVLLRRVAELEHDKRLAKDLLSREREEFKAIQARAIVEGRMQVLGAIYASEAGELSPGGVFLKDGKLVLYAEPNGIWPELGARYYVEIALSGEVYGVVEVVAHMQDKNIVLMECIDSIVPLYWKRLAEAALINPVTLTGVTLGPYRITRLENGALSSSSNPVEKPED